MLEVFINVILLRKPVIKKRIEYHDALNGKLKKTKKKEEKIITSGSNDKRKTLVWLCNGSIDI